MFERETRREKILEARNKELRLKEKTKGILGLGSGGGEKLATSTKKTEGADGGADGEDGEEEVDPIVKAERVFFQIIKQEQEARMEARKQKMEQEKDNE